MTAMRRKLVRGGQPMTCQATDLDVTANLRTLAGRAVPYGAWASRGYFLLSMANGCFDKSIKEAAQALPLLAFHNLESHPIGTASKWTSKPDGLWGEWALDDGPEAQRIAHLAQQGVLTGLSVGWSPVLQEWEIADLDEWTLDDISTLDRCTLREGRLVETSITPVPNYPQAHVTAVAKRPVSDTPNLDSVRALRDSLGI